MEEQPVLNSDYQTENVQETQESHETEFNQVEIPNTQGGSRNEIESHKQRQS
jgi:hypothetical protein